MKKYLYRFIPNRFSYLLLDKKIKYKEHNLKTDYIINIIHEFLMKYFFSSDINSLNINLWSLILRKKYGMFYNYYIEYLIEKKFITLISDYFVSKKSKTYKVNYFDIKDLKRVKIYDNILLNKYNKNYLLKNIDNTNNIINENIKKYLINDLYKTTINYDDSINYLNNLKKEKIIDNNKYYKNLISINSIKDGHRFFSFDIYGRFHSNFTILKKNIRQQYLKINNEITCEIDIKNSQPFFLTVLMKQYKADWLELKDVEKYFFVVQNGLIYDDIISNISYVKTKKEAKIFIYKVLFGNNNNYLSKDFEKLYPNVFLFIKNFKKNKKDYKSMSHELQRIESNFIFNIVINKIKKINKNIIIITIHDSIVFQCKYKNIITKIFNEELIKLKN